ncbi:MAG: hypothetical protein GF383_06350 [Candidatus Lokiarchaeota archaeon]|nr:hypothetical protein [Candidatus Lokiarchaeota archaeon]MBD3339639.1 hypothetical protein [Candidatus Lokiarchaeota archaeon]
MFIFIEDKQVEDNEIFDKLQKEGIDEETKIKILDEAGLFLFHLIP